MSWRFSDFLLHVVSDLLWRRWLGDKQDMQFVKNLSQQFHRIGFHSKTINGYSLMQSEYEKQVGWVKV